MTVATAAIQTVLLDARQPPILDHINYDGAPVMRAPLAAGSINLIAHDGALIAVERLPVESLPHAIRRGVLSDRAAALRALTPWAYLLIVGDYMSDKHGRAIINGYGTGWEWRSIQFALASVQELGCIVLNCHSDNQLGEMLTTLARRERGPARINPVRDVLFTTPGELLLQAIPGIGEDKAAQVLAQCPSVAWALVALTNPAHSVAGIGPKTIEAARAALGLTAKQNLSIDQPIESE